LSFLYPFGIGADIVRDQNDNTSSSLQAESIAENKISTIVGKNIR
jgi:hypothetical protein